jgi:uncharacterized protein
LTFTIDEEYNGRMALNPSTLEAIDVHVHIEVDEHGHHSLPADQAGAAAQYFGADHRTPTLPEIAAHYRERRMGAVVFTVDTESRTGHPAKGRAGARAFRTLVERNGLRGLKFHPSVQDFAPNDGSAYPLLEVAQELGLPALFHTGQTGIGAGLPGGAGIKLGLSNPMLLDEVAATFPGLTIIMAHPSFPWQDEALAVATHKPNAFIDLSGWSPKYFPPQLVRYANTLLQDKVLFGSDYPMITPDRWLADFDKLEIKPAVRPKILKQNAARVLGLA